MMDDPICRLIFDLAYNISPKSLTAIVRAIGIDREAIGDDVIHIFSSALCLSWMDPNDLYVMLKSMATEGSQE